MKLGYILCVLHLLESGKDAFHKEIHLTFRDLSFGGDDTLSRMYGMVTWLNLLMKMGNEDQVEMTRWKQKSDVQGRNFLGRRWW